MARYPNILCRVNAIKPEFVVRYVENFPKEPLPAKDFYDFVEKRMRGFHSRNYKQAPLQWGLYFEDGGYCYPRFNRNITIDEAKDYINVWLHHLVIPNPYCTLSQIKEPTNLIVLLCEYMKSNPNIKNLHDIAYGACKERVKAIDILKNTIIQTGLFDISRGNIRYYKVSVKDDYISNISNSDNYNSLIKIASYFKNVYDPEEELSSIPDNILGESISYDSLKSYPNIDMVLEFKPEYNIIVNFATNFEVKYKSYKNMNSKEYFHLFDSIMSIPYQNLPCQCIYYGAPGTGKSHVIKDLTKGQTLVRTTFHPDSDYSTFVGCYKPTMDNGKVYGAQGPLTDNGKPIEEPRITYQFIKQAFLKAYLGAWKKFADKDDDSIRPQFLIIEEINRGNCAQIFGDLFQLLDRGDNGFSEYPIEADTDLQKEIKRAFKEQEDYKLVNKIDVEGVIDDYTSNYGATLSEDIQEGRVLLLPKNLFIWATMNTSDQSLFPIDSAFKRRWEWKYMPIKNHEEEGYKIKVGAEEYSWWGFLVRINQVIGTVTSSEDKKLGYFFAKAENKVINSEQFVGKVLFYLWNDVFKNYGFDNPIFYKKEDKKDKYEFSNFFLTDGKPNLSNVNEFMKNLDEKIQRDESMILTKEEDNNSESKAEE